MRAASRTARGQRPRAYRPDLAHVHDSGFAGFARRAAPGILRELARRDLGGGLVVDVGCGTGVLAERLAASGYRVIGFDLSPAMLALARHRAPRARFFAGSFVTAPLPRCDAIVAVGEVLNYRLDRRNDFRRLRAFLRRAFVALRPGGVLIFDFLAPLARGSRAGITHQVTRDWTVLVTRTESPSRRALERRITTFRRHGAHFRRSDEIHALTLLPVRPLAAVLRAVGFSVRIRRSYGGTSLPAGHRVAVAGKPLG